MTEIVVATLNVNFEADSTAAQGQIKLEIDDRADGLNQGDTSFSPGDNAYFFLFKDENVTLITTTPLTTAGGVSGAGSGTKAVDENITFSNSDSGNLGYPPDGSVAMHWLGRSYEVYALPSGEQSLRANTQLPEVQGSDLKMAGGKKVLGLLKCTYSATGSLFKLSHVPVDIPEALIIALGTV